MATARHWEGFHHLNLQMEADGRRDRDLPGFCWYNRMIYPRSKILVLSCLVQYCLWQPVTIQLSRGFHSRILVPLDTLQAGRQRFMERPGVQACLAALLRAKALTRLRLFFADMAPPSSSNSSEASPTVAKTSDSERRAKAEKLASLRRREAELQADLLEIERVMLPYVHYTWGKVSSLQILLNFMYQELCVCNSPCNSPIPVCLKLYNLQN